MPLISSFMYLILCYLVFELKITVLGVLSDNLLHLNQLGSFFLLAFSTVSLPSFCPI